MKSLESILQGLSCTVTGPRDIPIHDIVFDSRKVTSGAMFVALKGVHQDGHAHIPSAVKAGAKAVISEQDISLKDVSLVRVTNSLSALAHVAIRFWDNPSTQLRMIGITGTNGKTTTSYLVESILAEAGIPTAVMGTINYRFGHESMPAPNTTPFSSDIQRFLAKVLSQGAKACAMEVSSHALELGRVEGLEFDTAVFTNLTQDHLDFHKTMEAYAQSKARLFENLGRSPAKTFPKAAVVNGEDPWSERMIRDIKVPVLRYRLHGPADFYTTHLVCDATGSRFTLHTPKGERPVVLPLLGDYNVMNALAAVGAALSQGADLDAVVRGLEHISGVPGRMERIAAPSGFTVVVDYAHTEDALRQVMTALRKLKPARLLTVFGCGGDRDRTKRPMMGEAAAQMSDEVVITSDNPRSEDASRIALDVEVGVRRVRSDHYQIILDREEAIARAFSLAGAKDIVLIAGKGHENYQILPDKTISFDDREVVRRRLGLAR